MSGIYKNLLFVLCDKIPIFLILSLQDKAASFSEIETAGDTGTKFLQNTGYRLPMTQLPIPHPLPTSQTNCIFNHSALKPSTSRTNTPKKQIRTRFRYVLSEKLIMALRV